MSRPYRRVRSAAAHRASRRTSRRTGTLPRHGPERAVAGVQSPTTSCAAAASASTSTTTTGPRSRCPATGGASPPFADTDGPLLYRHALRSRAARRRQAACSSRSTASSTRPTCGSTARTSAIRRATSSRTASTSPSLARLATEHVLAVEVTCSPQRDTEREAQHHRCASSTGTSIDPTWNPGGLWRPVGIETTGPVRIDRCRVLCRDANDARAHLRLARPPRQRRAADRAASRTSVDGVAARQQRALARARHERGRVEPRHRRPAAVVAVEHGRAAADRGRVEVVVDGEHQRSAHASARACARSRCRTGCSPSTASGCSSRAPTWRRPRSISSRPHADAVRRDIELAREAGLDLLRVHGHIARPELYDAADEVGMLVWQDFPLHGGYARTVRRQAVEQAREAVDVLGHHPSIVVWCAPRRRPREAAGRCHRPAAADVEPDHPRPLGEASVREGRRDPTGHRPQRRRCRTSRSSTAPTAISTSAGSTATSATCPARRGDAADGALRQRVRRPVGARRRPLRRHPSGGRTSTGTSSRSTTAWTATRWCGTSRPVEYATFDEWRRRDAAVPGDAAASSHRDAAPAEVPARRRVLPVDARRPGADDVDERCSTTSGGRSWPSPSVVDACRPVIVVADRLPERLSRRRGDGPRRARRERCAPHARTGRVHGDAQVARRQPRWRWQRRRAAGRLRARRHRPVRRARRAGQHVARPRIEHGDEAATNRYEATIERESR